MQWTGEENAGFTAGTPWLRVNSNYTAINVEKETIDPNSVLNFYKKLIALRKEKDIIVYGEFEPLCREDDQIFAYTRKLDEERLLTVCNFSEQSAEFEVPAEFEGSRCLITNLDRKVFKGKIVLKPYEAFVLYK
jgi:oligo-1,6-glucosidase